MLTFVGEKLSASPLNVRVALWLASGQVLLGSGDLFLGDIHLVKLG
jgi:hypothetical protein